MPYTNNSEATLGDILAGALEAAKVKKERKPSENLLFDIICGDPDTPKAEWEVYDRGLTLAEAKQRCKDSNDYVDRNASQFLGKNPTQHLIHMESDREYYANRYCRYSNLAVPPIRYGERDRFSYRSPEMTDEQARELDAMIDWKAVARAYGYLNRYAMRRVPVEQDFHAREAARTDNPVYLPTELLRPGYRRDDHMAFVEVLTTKPGYVSFYECRTHAFDNRRTEMRLGRFLTTYGDEEMDDNKIADFCAQVGLKYETTTTFGIATSREDCRRVYQSGPNSCMSGEHYIDEARTVHPAEAYASNDLGVAFIERNGEVTARCVVNRKTMQYLDSVYGDSIRLKGKLEEAGYTGSGYALSGAELLRIEVDNRYFALPYIDGNCREVIDDGKTLRIKEYQRIVSGDTSGRCRINR